MNLQPKEALLAWFQASGLTVGSALIEVGAWLGRPVVVVGGPGSRELGTAIHARNGAVVLQMHDEQPAAVGEGGGSDEEEERGRLEGLALKGALDPAGQERLLALMDRREAARVALQAKKRERAMYGGRTLAEIQEGGDAA